MDLQKLLHDLYAQKEALVRAIVLLEEMHQTAEKPYPVGGLQRRGRKSMGAAERREVSERMKRYWEGRRKFIE